MKIIKFIEEFPGEQSGRKHYWLKAKSMWQCSEFELRTTFRSGAMMENSNQPIRTWYLAMSFMTYSKKGISATEL